MKKNYIPSTWEKRCKELGLPEYVDLPELRAVTCHQPGCSNWPDCEHYDNEEECPKTRTWISCYRCWYILEECTCNQRGED